MDIAICHSWSGPLGHFHHDLKVDLDVKSDGARSPFFVGCHCSDNSGNNICKELVTETCLPSHARQPLPREVRLAMDASHSWSGATGHSHQALNLVPKVKSSGVRSPFLVGCHSLHSSGWDTDSGVVERFPAIVLACLVGYGADLSLDYSPQNGATCSEDDTPMGKA